MSQSVAHSSQQSGAAEELSRDELLEVLLRYNEATDRLRVSHEGLKREVARLTAELEQKNRELERRQRLAMLGEMAAGVAHEIRNPLGGISLYVDLLAEDLSAFREQSEIVVHIQGGIRILNRIVEDMLLFTRDLRMSPEAQSLGDLVRSAVELSAHEIARSGLRVMLDETALEEPVEVDGSLVARALVNLMVNAAQAAEGRGEASLRITTAQAVGKGLVAVVLEDTCGGIAAEDLPKIFNPFFTRREQGTGLGLAIVHRTIEAHGGQISAVNNAVGGATFTLTLPRATPSVAADEGCRGAQLVTSDHTQDGA